MQLDCSNADLEIVRNPHRLSKAGNRAQLQGQLSRRPRTDSQLPGLPSKVVGISAKIYLRDLIFERLAELTIYLLHSLRH